MQNREKQPINSGMKSIRLVKMARQDEVDFNYRYLFNKCSIRGQDQLLNWFIGGK